MVYVLDSSAFINAISVPENSITVPQVYVELRDLRSKELFLSAVKTKKLELREPSEKTINLVKKKAWEIGSEKHLSIVDVMVVALAYEVGGVLLTDDFTMQNLAAHLGIKFQGVFRGEIKEKRIFRESK